MRGPTAARGFTYLAVIFIVLLLGLTASMASALWSTLSQRDKERELVFAGRQFQAAIERYAQRSVPTSSRYPRRIDQLLRDFRMPQPVRHLRRVYIDPMTGEPEWGLIRASDGGIVGVHSLSERAPMVGTLLAASLGAGQARSYRDWRFIAAGAASAAAPTQ